MNLTLIVEGKTFALFLIGEDDFHPPALEAIKKSLATPPPLLPTPRARSARVTPGSWRPPPHAKLCPSWLKKRLVHHRGLWSV